MRKLGINKYIFNCMTPYTAPPQQWTSLRSVTQLLQQQRPVITNFMLAYSWHLQFRNSVPINPPDLLLATKHSNFHQFFNEINFNRILKTSCNHLLWPFGLLWLSEVSYYVTYLSLENSTCCKKVHMAPNHHWDIRNWVFSSSLKLGSGTFSYCFGNKLLRKVTWGFVFH